MVILLSDASARTTALDAFGRVGIEHESRQCDPTRARAPTRRPGERSRPVWQSRPVSARRRVRRRCATHRHGVSTPPSRRSRADVFDGRESAGDVRIGMIARATAIAGTSVHPRALASSSV
jgi:hypothetical protein